MIDVTLTSIGALKAKLESLPAKFKATLAARMQTMSADLVQDIKDSKLSGQVLREVSGRLKDSITGTLSEDGDTLAVSVGVEGDVAYAAIQEKGGSTKAHMIAASQGKALAFSFQGKQAFFAGVNHPGSQIPAHDFLGSALADSQDDILAGLSDAMSEALNE